MRVTVLRILASTALTVAFAAPATAQAQCAINLANCGSAAQTAVCVRTTPNFVAQCTAVCDAQATPLPANTCTSEAWYSSACGQFEQVRLESNPNASKCRGVIENGVRPAHTLKRVAMASTALGDNWQRSNSRAGVAACQSGSGTCNNVRSVASTRPVTNPTPMTGTLVGKLVGQAQGVPVNGQTKLENDHAPWRANGAFSGTCDEYVFHKYEGYALFEDATLYGLGNPRIALTVAYTDIAGDRSRRALGVRGGIYDWNQRALLGQNLFPAGVQPKNDFTAVSFSETHVDRIPVFGPGFQPISYFDAPDLGTIGAQPGLVNDALRNKLNALAASGDGQHVETFEWHALSNAAAAAGQYSDEELDRGAALGAELQSLLNQRAQTIAARVFCAPELDLVATSVVPSSLDQLSPVWNPGDGLDIATPYFEPIGLPMDLGGLFPGANFFAGPIQNDNGGGICVTLWDDALRWALYAIDTEIEALVATADRYGCIEPGFTRCDWSPGLFASRVRRLFEVQRQADFDRCLGETEGTANGYTSTLVSDAGEFTYLDGNNVSRTAVVDGVACQAGLDYRTNPDLVERYFACRRAKREGQQLGDQARVKAAVGAAGTVTLNNQGNITSLKQWKGDQFSGGNSMFGTTVSYGAGWELANLRSAQLCNSKAGLNANASIAAKVFGTASTLLAVDASLYAGQNTTSKLSVKVLGQELGLANVDNESLEFNLITGNVSRDQSFLSVSQIIMIGPFPVRVAASAAGFAGFDYDVSGDCDGAAASMTGSFRPYAGIKAQASAGISAVIVEVGMKIDLVLASLGLPLKAAIAMTDVNQPDGAVSFDAALDLEARFLDGRASLYAEVCYLIGCESWDFELFSWTGLRTTAQLFAASFKAPFAALAM
jgi:hypothetical protein